MRIVGLLTIACLAGYLALTFGFIGVAPYGNSYEGAYACTVPQALPAGARLVGGTDPSLADFPATMEVTYFPLGIICTVRLADPTRTEVFNHQSWPATATWLGCSAVTVLAIVLAILIGRRTYRQRNHPLTPL